MQPLTLDDLLPLAEYVGRRSEFFAAHARYLDRYRRVRVGPKLTLVFENRQTLWFRVHELLRVARLADPLRVQQQLDWYNRLLPARETLQAALLIDVPEGPTWAEEVAHWRELAGDCVRLHVGDASVPARLVTCRPEDRCAGAAHWLTFAVGSDVRRALGDRHRPAFVAADYQAYQHRSQPLSDLIRRSLLDDLESGARNRAA
jgi:Protein of unknown function (DUF3501)